MAQLITLEVTKTYANEKNAIRAVDKVFGNNNDLIYMLARTPEGRVYPVFIGMDALKYGVQFHFHIVA